MRSIQFALVVSLAVAAGCSTPRPGDLNGTGLGGAHVVNGNAPLPGTMAYHGGPVMHGTFNVYYVWYGNWSSNTAGTILEDLASNIGGSPYYNINTTYSDEISTVENKVHFGGSAYDNYSHGSTIHDNDVFGIVTDAIDAHKLPRDRNAVYFVLSSADVHESSGFCDAYCGWHSHMQYGQDDLKFAFVGNPDTQCASLCEAQTTSSPNDNPGADAMASVIARELDETATDPDLNAWFDDNQQENADKCVWMFGTEYAASNGSRANVHLGPRDYLIQENWVNQAGGYCALSYP